MGIYIKGMEMPKDEEMLFVNIYPDGKTCINLDLECKRIATAVPVPPHGRLIDADVLTDVMHNHYAVRDAKQNAIMDECTMMVFHAPTVIPSEEEQE